MPMKRFLKLTIFTFSCLLFLSASKPKDLKKVVINDVIKETQFRVEGASQDEVKMVWWLPTEFWGAIYAQNDNVSQDVSDQIVNALDKYTMIIVLDGKVTALGGLESRSSEEIRGAITVRDKDSKVYKPLAPEEIDDEAEMVLTIIKPVFSNLLGKMGESMEVLMFAKNGSSVLKPFEKGGDIVYGDTEIDLGLPLASLLEEKECPKDGALMSAKWDYCPFHGVKLD
jgi:hypothetical protein